MGHLPLSSWGTDIWPCTVNAQWTSHQAHKVCLSTVSSLHAKAECIHWVLRECKGPTKVSFDMWDQHMKTAPQFKFCTTVMDNYWWHVLSIPWGKGTSSYMFEHVTNSAAASMSWTTLTMHDVCRYTCVTWSSWLKNTKIFMIHLWKDFFCKNQLKLLVTWLKIKPMNSEIKPPNVWQSNQTPQRPRGPFSVHASWTRLHVIFWGVRWHQWSTITTIHCTS